ncbi:MAG: hypothetical protein ACI9N9_001186 [Enterobacterales bacterium]|jgi:hypothetical protein
MSDFRSRVKEDLIKNKVPVIKYSLEEHICDLELAVEMGEKRIAELEAKVIHTKNLNDFMSDRGIITRTQAAAKIKELESKIIDLEGMKVNQ